MQATLRSTAVGGLIFDEYAPDRLKFVALDITTQRVLIGHIEPNNAWVIDASIARTLAANTDYQLGVILKGTTISVTINAAFVLSHAFNAPIVDGHTGVLTRNATTSLDSIRIRTNDPQFAATAQTAQTAPSAGGGDALALDDATLQAALQRAREAWRALAPAADLDAATAVVGDLPELMLGQAIGARITIDATAAGWGWNVLHRADGAPRIDLDSVLRHELGHVLGLEHDPRSGHLMSADIAPGQVRLVAGDEPSGAPPPGAAAATGEPAQSRASGSSVLGFVIGGSGVSELDFGVVQLDEALAGAPATLTITVGNLLNEIVANLTATLTTNDGSVFSVVDMPSSLGPLGSATGTLRFTNPASHGTFAGTLRFDGERGLAAVAFSQDVSVAARVTAWRLSGGTLELDATFLGGSGPDALDHTLRFNADGTADLIGAAGVDDVVDRLSVLDGATRCTQLATCAPLTGGIAVTAAPGQPNALTLAVDASTTRLPVAVGYAGGGDDELAGPAMDRTRWQLTGPNAGSLVGLDATGAPDGSALTFTGVGDLRGAAASADTFVVGAAAALSGIVDGGLSAISGLIDSLAIVGLSGGAWSGLVATATDTVRTTLDHSGTVELTGGSGGALDKLVSYRNLEPISVLAPVANVTVLGNLDIPDALLVTAVSLASVTSTLIGVTLPSGLPSELILVGGTNATIESVIFAPPTGALTVDGRGAGTDPLGPLGGVELDVVGVIGHIDLPGADLTIRASVIAVLGVDPLGVAGPSPTLASAVPALATLGPDSPLAALVPLLTTVAAITAVAGALLPGGAATTTVVDTTSPGDNGAIALEASSTGLLHELLGAPPDASGLALPLDLAVALALVVGSIVDGGLVAIDAQASVPLVSATSTAAPAVATAVAQTIVLAARIAARDAAPPASDSLLLAALADAAGSASGAGLGTPADAAIAAAVVLGVAGTTIVASELLAEDAGSAVGPVGVRATNGAALAALADAGSAAGGAVAVGVLAQITTATLTDTTVRATTLDVRAGAGGTLAATATGSSAGTSAPNGPLLAGALSALALSTVLGVADLLGSGGLDDGTTAAALAVAALVATTVASLSGGSVVATTAATIEARTATAASAVADASAATSATGVGVAIVAPVVTTTALLAGAPTLTAPSITVSARSETAPGAPHRADATSGAGAAAPAGAGAIALGLLTTATTAAILGAATVVPSALVPTTDLTLDAASEVAGVVAARATAPSVLGRGPSLAVQVALDAARAALADGATLSGARDLTLAALADPATQTSAEGGAASAAVPVISTATALSIVGATAELGAGPALSLDGALHATAIATPTVVTSADAAAGGGAGAVLALTVAAHDATAATRRDIATLGGGSAGDLVLHAITHPVVTTTAAASPSGLDAGAGGAAAQLADLSALAQAVAATGAIALPAGALAAAAGAPGALVDAGAPGAAAALAATIAVTAAHALAPDPLAAAGIGLAAGGELRVLADGDTDSAASADAGGGSSIASAVALNLALVTVGALLDTTSAITSNGLEVAAGMAGAAHGANAQHDLAASALGGVSTNDPGLAAAFALQLSTVTSTALAGNSARGPPTAANVATNQSLPATIAASSTTAASADALPSGSGSDGSSIALAVAANLTTAALRGLELAGTGPVTISAVGSHATAATAQLDGATSPILGAATALAAALDTTLAHAAAPISASGGLVTISATGDATTASDASGATTPTAGAGSAAALTIALDTVEALALADVPNATGIELTATSAPRSDATAAASSAGAAGGTAAGLLASVHAVAGALAALLAPAALPALALPALPGVPPAPAAALAVDLAVATTTAAVQPVETPDAAVTALDAGSGGLRIAALANADAASAASAAAAGGAATDALALALTHATIATTALVGRHATLAGAAVAVDAGVEPLPGEPPAAHALTSTATAGAAGTPRAAPGAIALTLTLVTTQAVVDGGATVTAPAARSRSAPPRRPPRRRPRCRPAAPARRSRPRSPST